MLHSQKSHQDLVKALCEKYKTEEFFVQLVENHHRNTITKNSDFSREHDFTTTINDDLDNTDGRWWADRGANNDGHFILESRDGGLSSQISTI